MKKSIDFLVHTDGMIIAYLMGEKLYRWYSWNEFFEFVNAHITELYCDDVWRIAEFWQSTDGVYL